MLVSVAPAEGGPANGTQPETKVIVFSRERRRLAEELQTLRGERAQLQAQLRLLHSQLRYPRLAAVLSHKAYWGTTGLIALVSLSTWLQLRVADATGASLVIFILFFVTLLLPLLTAFVLDLALADEPSDS
jgi:hypothetical protein